MGKYQLQPGESVVKEALAREIKGRMSVKAGQLILTNRRLLFRENSLLPLLGLLGLFFSGRVGKFTIDLPLSSLNGLRRGKYGFNKNVLEISTAAGDKRRIIIDKFDEWIPIVTETVGNVDGVQIDSDGEEAWSVKKLD